MFGGEDEAMAATTLAFGRHEGKPLQAIPSGYLIYSLEAFRLATNVRGAIERDLRRRGVPVPTAAKVVCPRCGPGVGMSYGWTMEGGRNVIKRSCRLCGRRLGLACQTGTAGIIENVVDTSHLTSHKTRKTAVFQGKTVS
jgi:hypothetical protein